MKINENLLIQSFFINGNKFLEKALKLINESK